MRAIAVTSVLIVLIDLEGTGFAQDHKDASTLFETLASNGLALHKTLAGPGASQGASFSYSKNSGEADQFSSQFALEFAHKLGRSLSANGQAVHLFTFDGSIAGNVVTHDEKGAS